MIERQRITIEKKKLLQSSLEKELRNKTRRLKLQYQTSLESLTRKIKVRRGRIQQNLLHKTFKELSDEVGDINSSLSQMNKPALSISQTKTVNHLTHDGPLVIPKLRPGNFSSTVLYPKHPTNIPVSNTANGPTSPSRKAPFTTSMSPKRHLISPTKNGPSPVKHITSPVKHFESPIKSKSVNYSPIKHAASPTKSPVRTVSPSKFSTRTTSDSNPTNSPLKSFMKSPLKSVHAVGKRIVSGSKPIPAVTSNPTTSNTTNSTATKSRAAIVSTPVPRRNLRSRPIRNV